MKGREIIEALEYCINHDECSPDCPCFSERLEMCGDYKGLLKHCLDFINRLKTERNKYKIKAQYQKGELARLNKQVAEQKVEIGELQFITGLQNNRHYYRKFVDEVYSKEKGKELSAPDFDYIYELYFKQKAEIEMKEALIAMWCDKWKDQKAKLDKKDTEIDILIRKKESLNDEISELQHKIASCNAEIERLREELDGETVENMRLEHEIERLQGFYKPTETSGYKIENSKVIFYTNMLNGYRHEYENLDEVVKELNMMLQRNYIYDDSVGYFKSKIKELRAEKAEAIKEFWNKLKTHSRKMRGIDVDREFWDRAILVEDGDNLVKEMTEGGVQG